MSVHGIGASAHCDAFGRFMRGIQAAQSPGRYAEKRDLERNEAQQDVDNELKSYAKKIYRESISGYDSVNIDEMHLRTLDESWEYALMPVWLMTFKYKDKDYMYALNGQTGKTYGELPVSWAKLGTFAAIMLVVVFIIMLIMGGIM